MKEGWKEVKLKDISTKIGDGLHGTPDYDVDGEYYFVNGNNLENGKILIKSDTKRISEEQYLKIKKELNERTILIAINGTLGNLGFYKGEKIALGKSACYINLSEKVDKYFIRYVLEFDHFQNYAYLFATGSTIKNLGLKAIRNYPFLLPPLPTQRKIASILSAYDDLIENNLKRIKLLEEKAQLTYEEWFVRMKFPGHENVEVDEETGLPEGWERKILKDLCEKITKGTTPTSLKRDFAKEGVNFIKAESYSDDGAFKREKFAFIDKETNELLKRSKLKEFDVIVSIAGVLGRVALISKDVLPANTNQAVGIVRLNHNLISPYYIKYFLSSEYMNKLINIISGQAAQPNINLAQLGSFKVSVPPQGIIRQFHELINPIFETQQSLSRQNRLLKEARDILLPRLMSGMVDVEEIVGAGVDQISEGKGKYKG